jgi:hypothetical protein
MKSSYFAGLDLGQAKDYSALAIAETEGQTKDRVYLIRHLQRWALQTSYPTICADTTSMLKREPLISARLIADATGVGRPVVDLLKQGFSSRRLHAVSITGGNTENKEEQPDGSTYWNVPKRILVSTIQVLLQTQRLKIAPELAEAPTLARELQNFQVKITDSAQDTYGAWREGAHDDLVLAVALACWAAKHPDFNHVRIPFHPGGRAKGWGFGNDHKGGDRHIVSRIIHD